MHVIHNRRTDTNTLPDKGFRLVTLGGLALVDERGECDLSLANRRRSLAVLTVLAVGRRAVSRDRLAEMFWGDEEASRARHSVGDALSDLRRVLGPDSIVTRQLEVSLAPTCPLAVDVVELMEAAERRDHARVVALYAGPFMESVEAPSFLSFEHWVTPLRERLRRHWLEACAAQCLALARARKWAECAMLAHRWLDTDIENADAALYLVNALKAPGTPDAYRSALDEYAILEQRLASERKKPPAPEVARLVASIRDELARVTVVVPVAPAAAAAFPTPSTPAAVREATEQRHPNGVFVRRLARSRLTSVSFAAALFLGATSFTARRAASRPAHAPEVWPSIAVVDIRNVARDSASAWLELGFPQMVASGLERIPGIEVISLDRVGEARQAVGFTRGVTLTGADIVELGTRSGARWVVSASITPGDSLYVLDVTVRDTANAASPYLFTMTSPSLLALADEAAVKLATLATAGGGRSAQTEIAYRR